MLGVINSSPGDLAPVFDAMLEKATRLCGAGFGSLWIYEGEQFRAAAVHAVPTALAEFVSEPVPVAGSASLVDIVQGQSVVHVTDLAATELYHAGNPVRRAYVDLGGARTLLSVALRKDNALLGAFNVFRQEVRPFSKKEIALVQNFAAQAVIAIENARLITETREALEQQTATAEVLGVINCSPGNLAPVFDAILEKAHSLCGADFGGLLIYDGEYLRPIAQHNMPPRFTELIAAGFRPGHNFSRLMGGAGFAHVQDMQEIAAQSPDDSIVHAAVEIAGIRTQLMVPLRKDDKLLGVITANRGEVRPFTDKQIALLQNFAAQAVIAMENARLITETREALEQQTATAEVLGVINSSPGNLAPVLDTMLEKALRLCEAEIGVLWSYDGELMHPTAIRSPSPEYAKFLREGGPRRPAGNQRPLLQGERFVQIDDLSASEGYFQGDPIPRAAVDLGGVRSLLNLALRKDDKVLGLFAIYRKEVRPFSEKQIALLQNFAAQAVIAMENARLLDELRQRTEEVGELNRGLEARVAEQVEELGRVGRLKRFLAPQLAELIVSQGDEKILESHRREIVVVFCDLRGYTAFTETAEPEEVLDFLREYHGALGPLVAQFEGTLDQFSGDGIMVFFNDPVPMPDPAARAVRMAVAMREAASTLIIAWRERGRELGFGVGISQGYATLGQIGFAERSGYTAIGTVCNVAARLCAEAKDGQILLSQRVNVALKGSVPTEQVGALALKGLTQPVVAYNVPLAAGQPALRLIEGGPQNV